MLDRRGAPEDIGGYLLRPLQLFRRTLLLAARGAAGDGGAALPAFVARAVGAPVDEAARRDFAEHFFGSSGAALHSYGPG